MPEQQVPSAWRQDPKLITEVLSGLVKKSTWPEVLELSSMQAWGDVYC